MANGTIHLPRVLLWTNSSPNTQFASQTIAIDTSDYAAILIEVAVNVGGDSDKKFTGIAWQGETTRISIPTATYWHYRDFTVNGTSGVDVSAGVRHTVTGDQNGFCVPVKIYGIH